MKIIFIIAGILFLNIIDATAQDAEADIFLPFYSRTSFNTVVSCQAYYGELFVGCVIAELVSELSIHGLYGCIKTAYSQTVGHKHKINGYYNRIID